MPNINQSTTLEDVVQPLLDFLNREHPSAIGQYYVAPFGQFGQVEEPINEISVDLNLHEVTPELTMRVIYTLLRKSGSQRAWDWQGGQPLPEIEDPCKTPLRFRVVTPFFHMESNLLWLTYLVIDHLGDGFDAKAAQRQVALLVEHLEDSQNLDELCAEERAMFGGSANHALPPGLEAFAQAQSINLAKLTVTPQVIERLLEEALVERTRQESDEPSLYLTLTALPLDQQAQILALARLGRNDQHPFEIEHLRARAYMANLLSDDPDFAAHLVNGLERYAHESSSNGDVPSFHH